MAYSTDNPPALVSQSLTGDFKEWVYKSTDPITDVRLSGYFTNGYKLGMRKGDLVKVIDTDASPITTQLCIVTSATSTAVDLSNGTAVTATDTD